MKKKLVHKINMQYIYANILYDVVIFLHIIIHYKFTSKEVLFVIGLQIFMNYIIFMINLFFDTISKD